MSGAEFYFLSFPSANAATPNALSGFFLGIISGVILTFVGQWAVYYFQGRNRLRAASDTTKGMLQYVNMILCFEYAQLAHIRKILDGYGKDVQNLRRFVFVPLMVNVREGHLEKILSCPKFRSSAMSAAAIQGVVYAQTMYQKCLSVVEQFNQSLDPLNLVRGDDRYWNASIKTAESLFEGIGFTQSEASAVNENARRKLADVGKQVFGKKFNLAEAGGKIVLATEL